jgi:3'-phosphoadenosine 5'-phosphosulfate sulfotransferase (PAPS reductase)/FAD synthetase
MLDPSKLGFVNGIWSRATVNHIIHASIVNFPGNELVMSSSFGSTSMLLIDLVRKFPNPQKIPIIYIRDPKTEDFARRMQEAYRLNVVQFPTPKDGDKVRALYAALSARKAKAVLHGARAYQSVERATLRHAEIDELGFWRIYPLLEWSPGEVAAYMEENGLPYHPSLPRDPQRKTECGIHIFKKAS